MRWSTADSRRRGEDDPEREAGDRPDECCERPDNGAVGQQHETAVLLCGADGSEHSELSEPSLRDDREACGGDERRKEEEDGSDGEDGQRLGRTTDIVSASHGTREGRAGAVAEGWIEGVARSRPRTRVDEHVDPVRARGRWRDESELVTQLARVLDDAHERPSSPVERQARPDLEPKRLRHPIGHGDLAGADRVAAATESEEFAAVGAARDL